MRQRTPNTRIVGELAISFMTLATVTVAAVIALAFAPITERQHEAGVWAVGVCVAVCAIATLLRLPR